MFENVNFAFIYFSLYFFFFYRCTSYNLALDRNNRFLLVDYLQIFMYLWKI